MIDEHRRRRTPARRRGAAVLAVAAALILSFASACASNSGTTSGSTSKAPGTGGTKVGFIFVGPKDDYGYNQAAYQGSQEIAKAFPNLKVLTSENVPETDQAAQVMEGMIADGAKIIFAT